MANTVQTGASIWVVASRLTPLDAAGNLVAGVGSLVTKTLVKATMSIVYETGDAVAVKDAAGELDGGVYAIHGDIPKWATAAIEFALPDPQLEAMLTNGVVFNDTSVALGATTAPTISTDATGGTLPVGNYFYSTAAYNAWGRATPSPLGSVITTGATSKNVIVPTFLGTELGQVIYGRGVGAGQNQEMGLVPNIGVQDTSAASGTGSPATLSLVALTKPMPAGMTFQITGDTNVPKINFTVTVSATNGETTLAVSEDIPITITIAAAAIVPTFVDTGAIKPAGQPNSTDLTGGPGLDVGYQMAAMGANPNPNGFALEMWEKRIINGDQDGTYPYWWHVWPKVKNMHVMPRDFTNANLVSMFEGHAFPNSHFGSGPNGDFPHDTSQIYQRIQCGADVVPTPSFAYVSANY